MRLIESSVTHGIADGQWPMADGQWGSDGHARLFRSPIGHWQSEIGNSIIVFRPEPGSLF
jgi:hypothetical protein